MFTLKIEIHSPSRGYVATVMRDGKPVWRSMPWSCETEAETAARAHIEKLESASRVANVVWL